MEITLKNKNDVSDRDALVVMIDWETNGKKHKYFDKVDIGQTITVPDELGYAILARYKGCFVQKAVNYETKTMKAKEA